MNFKRCLIAFMLSFTILLSSCTSLGNALFGEQWKEARRKATYGPEYFASFEESTSEDLSFLTDSLLDLDQETASRIRKIVKSDDLLVKRTGPDEVTLMDDEAFLSMIIEPFDIRFELSMLWSTEERSSFTVPELSILVGGVGYPIEIEKDDIVVHAVENGNYTFGLVGLEVPEPAVSHMYDAGYDIKMEWAGHDPWDYFGNCRGVIDIYRTIIGRRKLVSGMMDDVIPPGSPYLERLENAVDSNMIGFVSYEGLDAFISDNITLACRDGQYRLFLTGRFSRVNEDGSVILIIESDPFYDFLRIPAELMAEESDGSWRVNGMPLGTAELETLDCGRAEAHTDERDLHSGEEDFSMSDGDRLLIDFYVDATGGRK